MARKIVFTSGKGGVGKTTIVANLGIHLALCGERIALIDADFGLNNLDVLLGVESLVVYDIIDAIEGRCRAKQALVRHYKYKNLFIMASNHTDYNRYISPQAVRLVIDALASQFDYILIDCPAGIDSGFHRAVSIADEAVVVATPHISSLRDADKVISVLKSYKLNEVQLLVNMVRGDLIVEREILSPREIYELLKIPLLGVVPESDFVYLNSERQGEASKAFKLLSQNLVKGQRKIYNTTTRFSGLLGGIKRSIRRSL